MSDGYYTLELRFTLMRGKLDRTEKQNLQSKTPI